MKQFRKKPVIIEAIQWTNSPGNFTDILEWSDHKVTSASPLVWEQTEKEPIGPFCLEIKTLEGVMLARLNDWIIKGVNGEFYPCKPDIFEKTYDPVE
jgi:hypothetical protein